MAQKELSPQGYIITKDPVNTNPFWEQTGSNPQADLPSGGTSGQVLTKNSAQNYDASWKDLPSNLVTKETLSSQISGVNETITRETEERKQDVEELQNQIDGLQIPDVSTLTQDVATLKSGQATLTENLKKETSTRTTEVSQLNNAISALQRNQESQAETVSTLSSSVSTVVSDLSDLNGTVTQNNNTLTESISQEKTDRQTAIEKIDEELKQEVANRQTAISAIRQVPDGGTVGQVLTKTDDSYDWQNSGSGGGYVLPQATSEALGGIKADTKSEEDTQEVKIDTATGKLYVKPGEGGGGYVLPQATSEALGGIKADTKSEEDTQEVKIDAATGKLYVKPGEGGGGYVLPQATSEALGGIKADTKSDEDTQEVKIDAATGKLYVKPGEGGGGGITYMMLAHYGEAQPKLSGDESIATLTQLTYDGSSWATEFSQYPAFRIDVLQSAINGGFHSIIVGNPLYNLSSQSSNRSYLSYWFPINGTVDVQIKSTNAGFSFQPLTKAGAVTASLQLTGVVIYGIR